MPVNFLDNLISDVRNQLRLSNKYTVYESLSNKYNKELLQIIFKRFFNINFSQKELELKEKRTGQELFRDKIIQRDKKCIITGNSPLMCEAAHIIPFNESTDEQKYDINNGILLNAGYHRLFDELQISIDPITCRVVVGDGFKNDTSVNKYDGQHVNINKETKKYLKTHYQQFQNKWIDEKIN